MSSFINITKNSSTVSNITKNIANFTDKIKTFQPEFLLLENGSLILQESNSSLIIDKTPELYFTNLNKN